MSNKVLLAATLTKEKEVLVLGEAYHKEIMTFVSRLRDAR